MLEDQSLGRKRKLSDDGGGGLLKKQKNFLGVISNNAQKRKLNDGEETTTQAKPTAQTAQTANTEQTSDGSSIRISSEHKDKQNQKDKDFLERLKVHRALRDHPTEYYKNMLSASTRGEYHYAQGLHDSPAKFRDIWLEEVQTKDAELHHRLLEHITNIELHQDTDDPDHIIPRTVTKRFLEIFLNNERSRGDKRTEITCCQCPWGLFPPWESNDVNNVVWKLCGKHLMHEKCFVEAVGLGKIPLYGDCECKETEQVGGTIQSHTTAI